MGETVTIHSRFNRMLAIAVWVLGAGMVVAAIASGDGRFAPLYPAAALLAFFAWAALWRPCVRVGDTGVTLQNVTHRVDVPWAALIHVDTRFALTLHTPAGKFAAWAAPAPGFITAARAGHSEANREVAAAGGSLRAGDLLGTESGNAALVVREQWRTRLDRGEITTGVADEVPVKRRWDAAVIAALAALTALTVWALAVTG